MNERYNSEKDLKNAFDNYQMPFDNDAFDKFKEDLDKEEKRKKFIWWMFYGKIIAPILIIGLIALALVYFPINKEQKDLSSADTKITNSTEPTKLTSATTITTNTNESTQLPSAITNISDPTESEKRFSDSDNMTNYKESNEMQESTTIKVEGDQPSSNVSKVEKNKGGITTSSKNNTSPTSFFGNSQMNGVDSVTYETYKTPTSSELVDKMDQPASLEGSSETLRSKEKGLLMLDLLMLNSIKSKNDEIILTFNKEVNPYKEKFKKYFYFNVGGGMTIEDNHGPFNSIFAVSKTNEFFWRTTVAYQVSPSTSFELSYMQKNLSIGFHAKGFNYIEKYDKKISLFKINMVNKIWSISSEVNLNMTNGVSIINAPSHINEFPDTKNTSLVGNLPNNISNINSVWNGLYDGTHLLYSSGLNVDISLSQRLDLNIGAEYTLGLNPIMSADLNYIEGEGIRRKLQAQTSSSFASASLGIKYSLRGK